MAFGSRDDIARFEAEMTLEQRLPERSILDVFDRHARRASPSAPRSRC